MTAQENEALVRSQLDLYNTHFTDSEWLEKKATLFTDDFEVVDIPSGEVMRGAEGFLENYRFFKDAFPDHQIEVLNVVASEDQVAVEFVGRGTHSGPLHMPTRDVVATGRRGELRCCNIYQIRDGKIKSIHGYYCAKSLLEQAGVTIQ